MLCKQVFLGSLYGESITGSLKMGKHCPVCDQDLPEEAFAKNCTAYDGLQGHCKTCAAKKRKEKTAAARSQPLFCDGCQQTFPADHFPKKRNTPLYCNACRQKNRDAYSAEYRVGRRDELNAYLREYRKTHKTKRPENYKEERARGHRERYATDPEYRAHVLEGQRERKKTRTPEQKAHDAAYAAKFRAQPEQRLKQRARYQAIKQDPERYAARRIENNQYRRESDRAGKTRKDRRQRPEVYANRENRRRQRERGQTPQGFNAPAHVKFLREWQQGCCYYCNRPLEEGSQGTHLEHIVPIARSGPNSEFNVVLSCPECNGSKGSRILWKEWRPEVRVRQNPLIAVQELDGAPAKVLSTFQLSERTGDNTTLFMLEQQSKDPASLLFFDWEWRERKQAILNMVASRQRIHTPISAHKLRLVELPSDVARDFLDTYHVQGAVASSVYLGLVKDNELFGVSAFRLEARQIEFTRMAFKGAVIGGLSKMFNHFVKTYNPENLPVLSYSDSRFASGSTFEAVGFEMVGSNLPHPSYVGPGGMFHRMTMMKRDMAPLLAYFEEFCTEYENARFNGYYRVQGLPLRRYVWRPPHQ